VRNFASAVVFVALLFTASPASADGFSSLPNSPFSCAITDPAPSFASVISTASNGVKTVHPTQWVISCVSNNGVAPNGGSFVGQVSYQGAYYEFTLQGGSASVTSFTINVSNNCAPFCADSTGTWIAYNFRTCNGVCSYGPGQYFPANTTEVFQVSSVNEYQVSLVYSPGTDPDPCFVNTVLGVPSLRSNVPQIALKILAGGLDDQFVVTRSDAAGSNIGGYADSLTLLGKSFAFAYSGSTKDADSYTLPVNAVSTQTVSSLANWHLWCHDDFGWFDDGTLESFDVLSAVTSVSSGPVSVGSAVDLSSCIPNISWNPLTDAQAIFNSAICYVRYFLEPGYTLADGTIHAGVYAGGVTSALQSHLPFSWVASTVTDVTNLASGFESAATNGDVCDAPSFAPFSNGGLTKYVGSSVTSWSVTLPVASGCPGYRSDTSAFMDLFGFKPVLYFLEELALALLAFRLAMRWFGFTEKFSVEVDSNSGESS